MKLWFLKRGYPNDAIEKKIEVDIKVKFSKISSTRKDNTKCVPLVVTGSWFEKYRPNCQQKFTLSLFEVKKVFTPKSMVSFRSAKKLSFYLVGAKFYSIERKVGSFKCKGKRCETCFNVNETDSFASSATKEEYKINNCSNFNLLTLIYLPTYKVCLKRYVGQLVDELRLRWKNYKSNNRKHKRLKSCIQEHLFEHFNNERHQGFLEAVLITFIDKTDPSKPLKRKIIKKVFLKQLLP